MDTLSAVAVIVVMLWLTLFVADETHERLIGICAVILGAIAQTRLWLRADPLVAARATVGRCESGGTSKALMLS